MNLPRITFSPVEFGDCPEECWPAEAVSIVTERFDSDWRLQLGDWVAPGAKIMNRDLDTADPAKYRRIHEWLATAGNDVVVPPPILFGG
jgi:hypothetical protein